MRSTVSGSTGRFRNVLGQLKVAVEVSPGTDEFTVELIPSFRRP
jgi:hypothetical protein